MIEVGENKQDKRWAELDEDRYGEYGVIGAEQADESHYDDRLREEDGDEDDDFGADGRIHFAKDKLYGREEELARCRELFETNEASAIFLSGYSGSGKSRVVEEFIKQNTIIRDRKPSIVFLRSKSEAMQTSVPFSSITGLFDNVDKSVSVKFLGMRDEIQETLGSDARLLLKVFPKLEKYLGKDAGRASGGASSTGSKGNDTDKSDKGDTWSVMSPDAFTSGIKKDTKKRMMLALQFFFRTLCSRFQRRLCIFLDDIQWADILTVELIESLLTDDAIKNLFFFGGYRSNEVHEGHNLIQKLQGIKEKREEKGMKGFLDIELGELPKEAIGQFIADSLRLTFDETLPLTNAVFTKTLGNPFFTRQALEYLVLKNALYYDTISFRWDWKLQEKELKDLISDDLLEMIKVKIEHLEPKLQEVLMTASCTRSTFDVETILVLLHPKFLGEDSKEEYEEEKNRLIGLLDQAVVEGFLVQPNIVKRASNLRYSIQVSKSGEAMEEEYAFTHDKIQETARSLIPSAADEFEFLERVGNVLSQRAEDPVHGEEWMLFTACELLNHVSTHYKEVPQSEKQEEKRPDFMDEEKQYRLAVLNLRTAELSIDLLAFPAALEFCEYGISYLPNNEDERWSDKLKNITLHLYSIAAQANCGVADVDEAERYCSLVMNQRSGSNPHVTTIEAIPVLLIYLDIASEKGERDACLDLCLGILREFGITAPKGERVLRTKVWWNLKQIKSRYLPTEESIQDLPLISDPIDAYRMELMKKAATVAYAAGKMNLYILLNCESVKHISEYGLTESSAASVASFANVLMHVYDDFKTSPKLAELAILIADRQQSKFNETQPLNTANHNVLGWVQPISGRLTYHERAYNSGVASGNLNGAMTGKLFSLQGKFFCCSITLPELERECRASVMEMKRMSQGFLADITAILWQMTLNLLGKSDGNPNTTLLTGEAIDESTDLYQKTNPHKLLFGPYKSFALLFFGDYDGGAEDALKRGDDYTKLAAGSLYGFETVLRATSLLIMARYDRSQKAYRKSAIRLLKQVRHWVKNGCVNLQGPHQLMEAEYLALQKNLNGARSYFEMAIASCRKHHFHHFAGLSCELYAAYLSEIGDPDGERTYLEKAIGNYRRWGSARKVDFLKRKLGD